jgi:hypothetical protein
VTPDGRFLVFPSSGDLTPDDSSRSGARQIFRYDAQTGELIRISVGDNGFNDNGNRSGPTPCGVGFCAEDAAIPVRTLQQGPRTDPTMSHDGSEVFFMSPVALTTHALNDVPIGTSKQDGETPDYAQNVYEWHAGHVYLISDGHDASRDEGQTPLCPTVSSVCLIAADGSGRNVFFSTADRLVPQDTDTSLDYYDARVCEPQSGNPCIAAPAAGAPCVEEACHGTPPAIPGAPNFPTSSFNGAGNAAPAAAGARLKVLSRVVHGARFVLQVSVPAKGRVTVAGAGIRTVQRSVSKSGVYRLRVALTAKQKRRLRHRHRIKLRLRVSFAPSGGASSSVTFSITDRA